MTTERFRGRTVEGPIPAPDAPREEHRLFAEANGYFWLPCIRCGRVRGGHEPRGSSIEYAPGRGMGTCCKAPEGGETSETMARVHRRIAERTT